MTIICVKDGVIAADGSVWQNSTILVSKMARKLTRSSDGAIAGAAGGSMNTQRFSLWLAASSAEDRRGSPPVFDKDADISAMWLEPDGEMWRLDWSGLAYRLVGQEVAAVGAASEMALGAMYAGASAEEAVRICVERHDGAGGEVFVERLAPVEAPPEDVDARPAETFGTDRVPELVNERRAAMAEWKERAGLA